MILSFFNKAAETAIYPDKRRFLIGCIGVRKDGVSVLARNGSVFTTIDPYQYKSIADSHAECRVLKKCGYGGILYVARVLKKNNEFAMARPCHLCQFRCKVFKIQKVYYTFNKNQYGIWFTDKNYDLIYDF
jgi:tRNA(Arg) A34 adenosine deaminase TadA